MTPDQCQVCGHPWIDHTHHGGRPIEDTLGCVGDRYPGVKLSGATLRCGCKVQEAET